MSTCPMCGRGLFRLLDGIDGPLENPTQPVSHLACVEKQEWEAEYQVGMMFVTVALLADAEAELTAPWHIGALIDVDGLKVGPHMVRQDRERISELQAEVARLNAICDRLAAAGHS